MTNRFQIWSTEINGSHDKYGSLQRQYLGHNVVIDLILRVTKTYKKNKSCSALDVVKL